jgi:hypothetical protein
MTPTRNSRRADLQRWLKPWRQPAPWLSLVLLVITATSQPPRLWFWLALLRTFGGVDDIDVVELFPLDQGYHHTEGPVSRLGQCWRR